jgi:hypothetical protein
MTRSDALPPAPKPRNAHAKAIGLLGLITVLVCLPWLTGCSATNLAASPANSTSAPLHTLPNSRVNGRTLSLSANLSPAVAGEAYSATISVSGGTAPYTFSLAWGSLPADLSLSGTGTISGTPTTTGAYNFGIHATDSLGEQGSNSFQLTVSNAGVSVVSVTPAITTIASSGTVQFTATVSNASNTAVTWSASAGTISSTGLYTAPTVSTNTTVTITATSVANSSVKGTATVEVTAPVTPVVTITPATSTIASAGTVQFTATVSNESNTSVTWSASAGTISSTGLYTAPTVSANTNVTVTATSVANSSVKGTATFQVTAPLTPVVTVTPSTSTIASSGTVQFTATVSNESNTSVTWSASAGSISSTGLYTAPAVSTNTSVTVTATSVANSSAKGTATVEVTAPLTPIVTVTTSTPTIASGGTAQFSASVSNSSNTAVTWSASAGTISSTGLFTAPAVFTNTTVTVTATSVANASVKGSTTIQVTAAPTPVVTVTPATATVASSGSVQFTASVTNTTNTAVTWSATLGTISSSGLYQAPAVTANTTATITAASVADTNAKGTATLTITAPQKPPLTITTTSLAGATAGTAYSATLQATGGTTPYTWTIASGILPAGLTLQGDSVSGTTSLTGQFSFTVEVTDSSSPAQTATQPLTLTVSAATTGPTIVQSFFGADFNGHQVWPGTDGMGNTATLAGLRLWDNGVKWSEIETTNGTYDWNTLDEWFSLAQSANLDVLYTFGATPQWAAAATPPAGCNSPGPYSCAPPTDVNPDGTGTDAMWQAFVTALVTHAAGRINYYELWNEPDCPCFWAGTTQQLVRMSQDAATIIRSLDPNAKILSPSAHGPTMATWFDGYIADGGAAYFDIVNVHMRGTSTTNISPEAFLTVYGQVETELEKRNLTSLPLWDDEHGILTTDGLTDPDELAGYVARSAVLRAGVGLQRQYIYTWDMTAPYGLQGNESGTAWDQVAGWLIGHSISPCTSVGTVYTCQLDYGQVVWDTSQSCSNGVCTYSNYKYPANYNAYRDESSPSMYSLSGTTVQIGYKPILLTNQPTQ